MQWARAATGATTQTGETITGVIVNDTLEPRAGLGSQTATGAPVPLAELTLLPPVVPGKFIGLWNNFQAAAEKGGHAHPTHPLYFLKPDSALSGPGATVTIPEAAGRVVFEGELGIVIGKRCKAIPPEAAQDAILGYTCVNDVTSLGVLFADPSFPQWTRAKGFDGFGVIGPVIATGLDWRDLSVRVLVNGRERQSYEASDMILSPPEIVSLLSHDMTLNPGDVIACGTSLGAAPVKAGMTVEVVIEGIGSLSVVMG